MSYQLRKFPKQKRSQKKYQLIQETAFRLIQKVGYEALTTDLIAEECGISVGSIYQFFPNKESIVFTHAEKSYLDLHDSFFSHLEKALVHHTKFSPKVIDITLKCFEKTLLEVKGYFLLESLLYTNPDLKRLDQKSNLRFAKTLSDTIIQRYFPKLSASRKLSVSILVVEIVDSFLRSLKTNFSTKLKKELYSEFRQLLVSYFSSLV